MKRTLFTAFAVLVLITTGCTSSEEGPPVIAAGAVCLECRMEVSDPAYAALMRNADGDDITFDAIECAVRYRRKHPSDAGEVWLADFETTELHPAAGMTIVRAGFPSPMGGGYAAFHDATRAREAAQARDGVSGHFDEFVSGVISAAENRP